jgi:hypothetical protein
LVLRSRHLLWGCTMPTGWSPSCRRRSGRVSRWWSKPGSTPLSVVAGF